MKLEIFFDYLCEFCEEGHRYWRELLPRYPGIEPVYRPCEAHPRLEEPWGRHSDLAIQGMLFLQERGGDLAAYHDALFRGVYIQGKNIERLDFLAECAQSAGADATPFLEALRSGVYERQQREANRYAYGESGVKAVPTYILEDGRRLDAVLGVGVSKARLEQFFQSVG